MVCILCLTLITVPISPRVIWTDTASYSGDSSPLVWVVTVSSWPSNLCSRVKSESKAENFGNPLDIQLLTFWCKQFANIAFKLQPNGRFSLRVISLMARLLSMDDFFCPALLWCTSWLLWQVRWRFCKKLSHFPHRFHSLLSGFVSLVPSSLERNAGINSACMNYNIESGKASMFLCL